MINANINIIGAKKLSGLSYSSEAEAFRAAVRLDGGSTVDMPYLNSRILHAKENNYYNDIILWHSMSFGYKQSNGFVSKIYDVINPNINSLIQNTGSQRPSLILSDSSLNNKISSLSDGIDDIMTTSHGNELLPDESQYCLIFVFKPVTYSSNSNKYLLGSKADEVAPACSVREFTTTSIYRFPSLRNLGTSLDGQVITIASPGNPVGNWYILINSINNHTFYKSNNTTSADLGNFVSDKPLLGASIFGNQRNSNPTTPLTNYYFAERLLIKGSVDGVLANNIRDLINTYYNIF